MSKLVRFSCVFAVLVGHSLCDHSSLSSTYSGYNSIDQSNSVYDNSHSGYDNSLYETDFQNYYDYSHYLQQDLPVATSRFLQKPSKIGENFQVRISIYNYGLKKFSCELRYFQNVMKAWRDGSDGVFVEDLLKAFVGKISHSLIASLYFAFAKEKTIPVRRRSNR